MNMEFIEKHLSKFGVLGTNVSYDTQPDFPVIQYSNKFQYTHNNHLKFGYNGVEYNVRQGFLDIFWTEYGKVSRRPNSFREELVNSFRLIYETYGKFSLQKTNEITSEVLIRAAKESGVPFKQIIVNVDELTKNVNFDSSIETSIINITRKEFDDFMDEFSEKVRNERVRNAYIAYAGLRSDFTHVYDDTFVRIINQNYDIITNCMAGPAYWSLIDNEMYFSVARYLALLDRPGVVQIFKYTPELVAALFNDPMHRMWFQQNQNVRNNTEFEHLFLKSLYSDIPDRNYWNTIFDKEWEEAIDKKFHDMYLRCNDQHSIPLKAFLEDLLVGEYSFEDSGYD